MKFDQVVFAGGGNRCFWQLGFWKAIAGELEEMPSHFASVSAGSAMACTILMDKIDSTLDATMTVMSHNRKNRYLSNLFSAEPIHPHARLYRKIIHQAITHDDLKHLKRATSNRIVLSRIPSWLGPRTGTLVGICGYQLEKKLSHPIHPRIGRTLGFRPEIVEASSCNTVDKLGDLILASSCTPPFTPILQHAGLPALDGGMVDNVPLHAVSQLSGNKLILLSRPYKTLPSPQSGLTYVQPSRAVDANAWDYTDPQAVKRTYDQGREDGLKFLSQAISA